MCYGNRLCQKWSDATAASCRQTRTDATPNLVFFWSFHPIYLSNVLGSSSLLRDVGQIPSFSEMVRESLLEGIRGDPESASPDVLLLNNTASW